ncbi:maleylpyruvate isomerase family mycothiol-dependent enzyme [Nakamurella sp. PAMC28650]|uniref:maleylpyruvate isomerase family mycothiol-dependent enzyme n=1 Tax=Nakamurella sp. PAMC28650 TaxID=2762325 RepID=UPI00164E56A8|nr:maleylpyruvate isomerase family mycothiol-dependent enzyme [Nakamurella sp. PAMC28650]QNK82242.1 maleylpyruvate isomerase family mycothiol-dependent enzyme [Nakamurella sp. PAMC28650]
MPSLDYTADVRRESDRFSECLQAADPAAPVPSCPGWNAADLLWHLTQVQLFWARIVGERTQQPDDAGEAERPDAPYSELLDGFRRATEGLLDTLASADDAERVWTWADDQSVGFIRRRQAHEALIHRLDAELTIGQVTPLEPLLAADGVDEALHVMFGGYPAWATFTPSGGLGRVLATDTGRCWDCNLGRFSGTSPHTGKTYDEPTLEMHGALSTSEPAFLASGTAAHLDAWLWGRREAPELTGDRESTAWFGSLVAAGIQ